MMKKNRILKRIFSGTMSLAIGFAAMNVTPFLTAYAEEQTTTDAECVPGEIVVIYDNEVTSEETIVEAVSEESEVQSTTEITSENEVTVTVIQTEETGGEEQTASELQKEDGVLAASPNYILELFGKDEVNDASLSEQTYLETVKAYDAWDLMKGVSHEKVRVGVLDTGCDVNHEDLSGVINKELSAEILSADGKYAALKGDNYKLGIAASGNGHGTHMCGLIAAETNNEKGIAGVGSGLDNSIVDLVAIDVFCDTNTNLAYVIAGLEYARSINCKIINLSLGIKSSKVSDDSVFKSEIQKLYDEGIILICAAGNYGTLDGGQVTTIPADYKTTIGVIALNEDNTRAAYSDYGSLKDISAPGAAYSTMPDNSYGTKSGTSISAAIVSGVAAMLCSIDPSLTADQLKNYLVKSATDLGDEGYDNNTAYGLLNAQAAVKMILDDKNAGDSKQEESQPDDSKQENSEQNEQEDVTLPYTDVSENAWYYDSVKAMYQAKIMTGKSTTIFDPNATLNRAEFAVMMYRLAGNPDVTYENIYPDVPDGTFYSEAVTWAYHAGVITGYSDGTFGPANPVIREQIATILYRYEGYIGGNTEKKVDYSTYPDSNQVDAYASEGMKWAIGNGIIKGTGEGYLYPGNGASRAECAAMFARYLDR